MTQQKGFSVAEVLLLIAIASVIALPFALPYIYSRQEQRNCIRQEEKSYLYPMFTGKVTVLIPRKRMECVEWEK